MVWLNPSGSFSAFDKKKLIRFAQFYPFAFSALDLVALDSQLETYYVFDMRSNTEFLDVKVVGYFAETLVNTKKDIVYPLICFANQISFDIVNCDCKC